MAAQQAQTDELRDQVATLHNAHLAVFGQQQVIEQFTKAARDFEGVDVTMCLEEHAAASSDAVIAGSEETETKFENARDAAAAVEGLASLSRVSTSERPSTWPR